MINVPTLALLATLAFASGAAAQSSTWNGTDGTHRFLGCYLSSDDTTIVLCDETYTLTKDESLSYEARPNDTLYYTASGAQGSAYAVSVAGSEYFTDLAHATSVKDVPVRVSYAIKVPNGLMSFPAILMEQHRVNNVVISKNGAPSMVPATPVAQVPVPRPTVPAPTPNTSVTGFNIQLTNCKVSAGVYTCTATLTPR